MLASVTIVTRPKINSPVTIMMSSVPLSMMEKSKAENYVIVKNVLRGWQNRLGKKRPKPKPIIHGYRDWETIVF